jgi:hypothetical protein
MLISGNTPQNELTIPRRNFRMSTTALSMLRHHLKSNLFHINFLQDEIRAATWEITQFYNANNPEGAYYEERDRAKLRKQLAKLVDMQKRIKVEIAAIFRNERIQRKYVKVFGKLPQQQIATSHEQEAMLDQLLKEKSASEALAISE